MDQWPFAFFSGKFVWTNGAESSSKVSPETGSGPWMALPNFHFFFSLRSCRSLSVNSLMFRREIWQEFCWIFSCPQTKGSKNSGQFRSIFRKKFVAQTKNISCEIRSVWLKGKVHSFLGFIAFLWHAPKKSSASKM